MIRRLYSLLIYCAVPFATALVLWRGLRDRSYRQGLSERFGWGGRSGSTGSIWLHAVSLGEMSAAAPLVRALRARYPDNPLVLKNSSGGFDIVSGGNFHGAPVAAALDFGTLAMTDLISIAERRVDRMVNPDLNEGLPPFHLHGPAMPHDWTVRYTVDGRFDPQGRKFILPSRRKS